MYTILDFNIKICNVNRNIIILILRGRYNRMSCLRLTNVQHRKNCFALEITKKATVITKKRVFHHIKLRTLPV